MKKAITILVMAFCLNTNAQIITTVAGYNTGYAGDGGAATNAELTPYSVAIDAAGNLYIADRNNNRIRKVNTTGIISTFAGDSTQGYSGDGGAATAAELYAPSGVAFDATGNLYIADFNNVIRKVTTAGIITTIAGNGTAGYSGDGAQATAAELNYPWGIACDAVGNLYIADSFNNRIRKVTTAGIISTVAGYTTTNGFSGDGGAATSAKLYQPEGVAIDAAGNLYIADIGNNRIRKVNTAGIINTFAGNGTAAYSGDGGTATAAEIYAPQSVTFDAVGNLYIADIGNERIRMVNIAGIISTIAGNGIAAYAGDGGSATAAELNAPYGVALDAVGNLYIADGANDRIRKVNTAGTISTIAGGGVQGYCCDGAVAISAELNYPFGVAFDAAGNMYIADSQNARIRKVNTSGIISTVAGGGSSGLGGPATAAQLSQPKGVAIDVAGNMYIADAGSANIYKVNTAGIITSIAGSGGGINPSGGIAVDAVGNLYFSDNFGAIWKINLSSIGSVFAGNGTSGYTGDGGNATAAELNYPFGVACDATGNVFFADEHNNRVRKVNVAGIISTVVGNGTLGFSGDGGQATNTGLYYPIGVAVDTAGNLYIADTQDNRIRKVNTAGIISTIAGNGTAGYTGDGGNATSAELNAPAGLAFDASGNLYIADVINNVIRKVTFSSSITAIQTYSQTGNDVNIYPNPSNGSFTIETNSTANQTIQVYDINGQMVLSQTINGKATIDATSLTEGVYNISIISNEGVINKRVVIVK